MNYPKMSDIEAALAHEQVLKAALSVRVTELQEEIARIEGKNNQMRERLLEIAADEDNAGTVCAEQIADLLEEIP
jgi:uncharacterized coiled-coil protein SlyX